MTQNKLRENVRLIKATEDITYKEIAENLLDMSKGSFYNFMSGLADLSYQRSHILEDYINTILE